jgi:hypothetical protein
MPGFREAFRQGRDEARARRGPLPGKQRDAGQDRYQPPPQDAAEYPDAAPQDRAGFDDLQAALQERDAELAEALRLVAELKDYAEQLQSRVVELIAGAEPMAKALRLPGVKTFLLNKFHPDKYPDADERQRALLTEAIKTINAAYAHADELQTPPSE